MSSTRRTIAVLADDLSGAAEVAGAAANLGFGAEVQIRFDPATDAEVVCLSSDTRTLDAPLAVARVTEDTRRLATLRPAWFFKKCDSVLRGNVAAESLAMADALQIPRVLLAPANPQRGRFIRNGIYYLGDLPLADTPFGRDPIHPIRQSQLCQLVPDTTGRIEIPDIGSPHDLEQLAERADRGMLPVGGVDFFRELLARRETARTPPAAEPIGSGPFGSSTTENPMSHPALFACGSLAAWQSGRRYECEQHRIPLVTFPSHLLAESIAPADLEHVAETVCQWLRREDRAFLAIGEAGPTHGAAPETLSERLGEVVRLTSKRTRIGTLCLEGGAAALAVLQKLAWHRFRTRPNSPTGIGWLVPWDPEAVIRPPDCLVKPGSYPWPPTVWA